MPTIWDDFIASFPASQQLGISTVKTDFPNFEEFTTTPTDQLTSTVASQSLSDTNSYLGQLVLQMASNAEQVMSECTDGMQRLEQLVGKYPAAVQNGISSTIEDMISRGAISSVYDLKTNAQQTIIDYLTPFQQGLSDYSICAHPFLQSQSANLISSANQFIKQYIRQYNFSFPLNIVNVPDLETFAINYQELTIILFTTGTDPYAEAIVTTQPSPDGRISFNHSFLDNDGLPSTLEFKIAYAYKDDTPVIITNGQQDNLFSISLPSGPGDHPSISPAVNIDYANLPNEVYNGYEEGVNTMNVETLATALSYTLDPDFTAFLSSNGISSLADVRAVGGLIDWSVQPDPQYGDFTAEMNWVDAHARLEKCTQVLPIGTTESYRASEALINVGLSSATQIASMPVNEIVKILREQNSGYKYGDLNSVNVYNRARIQASLTSDYLNGYITLGQKVMENLDTQTPPAAPSGPETLTTSGYSKFLESLEEKCACTDCETALSPQAYLLELIDFISTSIKTRTGTDPEVQEFVDITFLQDHLFQPFDELAGHCEDVDRTLCQQRIAVEILRKYATTVPDSLVQSYAQQVQQYILSQIGTSKREALAFQKQTKEKIKSFADGLGLHVDVNSSEDIALLFDLLLHDFSTESYPEQLLESLYGVRSTEAYQLSQGLVFDISHQTPMAETYFKRWRLDGVVYGKHTDSEGKIYIDLSYSGNNITVNLYKDSSGIYQIASGSLTGNNSGIVKLDDASDSGVTGYFEVTNAATVSFPVAYIRPFSELQCRKLRYLYDLYYQLDIKKYQDDPELPITQVAIDPDIVVPEDIFYPWSGTQNPVFEVWQARKNLLNDKEQELQTILDTTVTSDIPGASGQIFGIAADLKGNVFVGKNLEDKLQIAKVNTDGSYTTLADLTITGPDTGTLTPYDVWFNNNTNKLLVSYNAADPDKKIVAYDIVYNTVGVVTDAEAAWRLKDLYVTGFGESVQCLVRQNSDGDLILANKSTHQLLKYPLPSSILSRQGNMEKPFVTKAGTLLVPDSGRGAVYEVAAADGSIIRIFGNEFKVENEIYLKLNETSGTTTAVDSSGHNLDGTLVSGAVFSDSPAPDYGVIFSDSNAAAYVSIPTSTEIDDLLTEERSVEIWFQYDGTVPAQKRVIYREGDATNGFMIYLENQVLYILYIDSGSVSFISKGGISINEWHQLIFVLNSHDGENQDEITFSGYLDGVQIGEIKGVQIPAHAADTAIGNIGGASAASLWADGTSATGDHVFSGLIHNYRLWNRVLTVSEVKELYSISSNLQKLTSPVAACISDSETVFIADASSQYVFVFDRNGNFLRRFGGANSSTTSFIPGLFSEIGDITKSSQGEIFVLDVVQQIIQVFDEAGSYIRSFGSGIVNIASPAVNYTAIDAQDNTIYLVGKDTANNMMQVYLTDVYGNSIYKSPQYNTNTPIDISVLDNGNFAFLYYSTSANECWIKIGDPENDVTVTDWFIGGYAQNVDGTLVSASPVTAKGVAFRGNNELFITDNDGSDTRLFSVDKPVVVDLNGGDTLFGVSIDRSDRIYLAVISNSNSEVRRYSKDGMELDESFATDGVLGIPELKNIVVDAFEQIYTISGATGAISLYSTDGILQRTGIGPLGPNNVPYFNIGPAGRLLATGVDTAPNYYAKVIDPINNFGLLLNSVFSDLGTAEAPESYWTYANLRRNELKGEDMKEGLANLNLSSTGYRYLEDIRESSYQEITASSEEWEYVKNILVNSFKKSQYKTWKGEEGVVSGEPITFTPYYFRYNSDAPVDYEPIPYRTTIRERTQWVQQVAARYKQVSQLFTSILETLKESDDQFLPILRDSIINQLTISGKTTLKEKADYLQKHLVFDFQYNCCSSTTRVSTALHTLQNFVFAVRDSSYILNDTTDIAITYQSFDRKWSVMGSYDTWRATTFAYIYPENLLQPLIKPLQSEMFKEVARTIGESAIFTTDNAYKVVQQYTSYFKDICNLKVLGGSRVTEQVWAEKKEENVSGYVYPNYNYIFAQSDVSGKIYYTVADVDLKNKSLTKIIRLWQEVPNLQDYQIIDFCGLDNFRRLSQSWLYLFIKAYDKNGQLVFGFIRFDTFTRQWDSQFNELELPTSISDKFSLTDLSIKVEYLPFMWERPFIGICTKRGDFYRIGMQYNGMALEEGDLKKDENGKIVPTYLLYWAQTENVSTFELLDVINVDYLNTLPSRNKVTLIVYYENTPWGEKQLKGTLRSNSYDNVFNTFISGYNTVSAVYNGFFINLNEKSIFFFFDKLGPKLINLPIDSESIPSTTIVNSNLGPGNISTFIVNVASQEEAELFNICLFQVLPYVYNDVTHVDPLGINFLNRSGSAISKFGAEKLAPKNSADFFYSVPTNDSKGLATYALNSSNLFAENRATKPSIVEYIAEAFYYLPMLIAGKFQQNGDYLHALDWYRTIYNYPADTLSRKIYYGLISESNLQAMYDKSDLYLKDTLNPHSIAITRPDAYTRYTVASIAFCLLEYADWEFTTDTAESVARADQLYNQALELIELFNYDAPVNKCSNLIESNLTATVTDPLWKPVWEELVNKLSLVEDHSVLLDLIGEINTDMSGTGELSAKLTMVNNKIVTVLSAQQGFKKFTEIIQVSNTIAIKGENYINSQKQNVSLNPVKYAGNSAGQKTFMSDTENKLIQMSDSSFANYVSAVNQISTGEVFSFTDGSGTELTITQLDNTFTPYPTGNVYPFQTLDVPLVEITGNYSVNAAYTDSGLAMTYDPSFTTPEQLGGTISAGNMGGTLIDAEKTLSYTQKRTTFVYCVPPNPLLQMLKLRGQLNLYKIRNCRNIAGAVRELEPFSSPTDATTGIPFALNGTQQQGTIGGFLNVKPTQYRYSFLIERAKSLCSIAQQMENSMLSSLEKLDAERYAIFKAKQDLALTKKYVDLQEMRTSAADTQLKIANSQKARISTQIEQYQELIADNINGYELTSLVLMQAGFAAYAVSGILFAVAGTAAVVNGQYVEGQNKTALSFSATGQFLTSQAQFFSQMAAYQRRMQEWENQKELAEKDQLTATHQITFAEQQVGISKQEKQIAQLQSTQAQDTMNFLQDKFTNVALYAFMSNQLHKVYQFFLNQATSTARLAAAQLSFERQQDFTGLISDNYYKSPEAGQSTNPDQNNYKGLTGSATLLQDIYTLDSKGLETKERKLQVSKTISLASLDPVAFQQFTESGLLAFGTTQEMFDSDFPGQYMRIISRVRVNVIALISPVTGIKATLRSLGSSRVTVGSIAPQEMVIRRDPEMIALTSAAGTDGVFEMQQLDPELYRPFEGSGVEMNWVFEMPKYTNRVDYSSILDVQLVIDYTSYYSDTLRDQVLKRLGTQYTANRALSMKLFYPDAWYDLFNPAPNTDPTFSFDTYRDLFPVNMDSFTISNLTMYFQTKDAGDGIANASEVTVASMKFTPLQSGEAVTVEDVGSINSIISTNFLSGLNWIPFLGKEPFGTWTVELESNIGEGIQKLIAEDRLEDIIFVIEYSAELPPYNTF